MKNVRLYHYREGGREGGVEPGWDIIVLECDCGWSCRGVWLAGWFVRCFSLNSVGRANSPVEHFIRAVALLFSPRLSTFHHFNTEMPGLVVQFAASAGAGAATWNSSNSFCRVGPARALPSCLVVSTSSQLQSNSQTANILWYFCRKTNQKMGGK